MAVVGGVGVGKTSFIRFIQGRPFDSTITQSTEITQTMLTLHNNNKQQSFRVWDICASALPCASLYYSQCEIIMLCYAINSQTSYDFAVNMWLEIKKKTVSNPNIVFLFVGLKQDMEEEREVPIPIARRFATLHNMLFYEISLLSGCDNKVLRNDLMYILNKTRAIRITYLLHACYIQLKSLKAKEEGKNIDLQELNSEEKMKKNPYEARYYNYNKEELKDEMKRLKGLYLDIIEKKKEDGYHCILSKPYFNVPY